MIETYLMNRVLLFLPLFLLAAVPLSCGCDEEPECRYNADCNMLDGEICQKGKCVAELSRVSNDSGSTAVDVDSVTTGVEPDSSGADTASASVIETDSGPEIVVDTSNGACVANSECNDNNPCTADFCNTSIKPYQCESTPVTNGVPCDDGDPCLGKATCQDGTCVVANSPCAELADEQCVRYEASCDANNLPMCTYEEIPINENEPCIQGSPCVQGTCTQGKCTNVGNPCNVGSNACTAAACEISGENVGEYACLFSNAPNGVSCELEATDSQCWSTETSPDFIPGYCAAIGEMAECIPTEIRKCYDPDYPNICAATVCVEEDGTCEDVLPLDVAIHVACGEIIALEAPDFLTRDYYVYGGGSCSMFDVRGKEVALTVDLDEPQDVTVTVVESGGQDIVLNHLTDMCNPDSCMRNEFDEIVVSAMAPTDAILVEAGIGNPPALVQLSVSCTATEP